MDHGADGVGLDVFERLVGRVLAEVDTTPAAQQRQPAVVTALLEILFVFALGRGLGLARDDLHVRKTEHVLWPTPLPAGQGADTAHVLAVDVGLGADDEHALGMPGGEHLPARRGAGLKQHGRALRRRFGEMAAVDTVVPAVVMDVVHLGRVGIDACHGVFEYRAVLPTRFPQLVAHVAILVRDLVASVVFGQAGVAVVAARAFEIGGDDVPGDAALGEMVERRYEPRERERMVLQRRTGEAEPEMLRGMGHGRNEQHRIVDRHLRSRLHRGVPIAAEHVVHSEHVGQEDRVELAAFQQLGEFDPAAEVGVVGHVVVVAHPQARRLMDHAIHVEGVEVDAFLHTISPERDSLRQTVFFTWSRASTDADR